MNSPPFLTPKIREQADRAAPGRTCLLVLGMHRSGTSAIARVLSLMGAKLPANLLPADPTNETGHWEPERLVRLNDKLLAQAGSQWDDFRALDLSQIPGDIRIELEGAIARLINEEYAGAPLFVLKDPRLCRLVPLYVKLLADQGIEARPVLILRNPLAVARSLAKRNGLTEGYASLLWLRHVLDAELATRGLTRSVVSYQRLVADWRGSVGRIAAGLGLNWKAPVGDAAEAIDAFVNPALQHHAIDPSELETPAGIWVPVKEASLALQLLEDNPGDRAASARLDTIRSRLDAAEPVFWDAMYQELAARRDRAQALRKSVTTHERENARLNDQLRAQDGAVKRLAGDAETLSAKPSDLSQKREAEIAALAQSLAQRDKTVGALASSLAERDREVAGLKRIVTERDRGVADLKRTVTERDREIADLKRNVTEQDRDVANLKRNVTERDRDVANLKRSVTERDREIAGLKRTVTERDRHIAELHSSTSWRITAPMRVVRRGFRWLQRHTRLASMLAGWLDTRRFIQAVNALLPYYQIYVPLRVKELIPEMVRAPIKHRLSDNALASKPPRPATLSLKTAIAQPNLAVARKSAPQFQGGRNAEREVRPTKAGANLWWSDIKPPLGETSRDLDFDVSAALTRMQSNPNPPAIVVPIYNAPDELAECVESLLEHTSHACRIILVNDASPDPRVREILGKYEKNSSIEIYHNDRNLGFTRTVNRGIALAGESDVVFLNSDTRVTPYWLRNLRLAAYSRDNIATATPLSNNGGAFSAPAINQANPLPDWLTLDEYARLVGQVSPRRYPQTPTGGGFCMYVRRHCIDDVGLLDGVAFPRGYGEENDFCMRALRRGWIHVVDEATLIYHVRSASFGDAKTDLMKQGRSVVDDRYPEYARLVRGFIADPNMAEARKRIADGVKRLREQPSELKPRVLYVISTTTGGTPQANEDLMGALGDRISAFLLRCDAKTLELSEFSDGKYQLLEQAVLSEDIEPLTHWSAEYDQVVGNWLAYYAIDLVHVRHIAWHSLSLVPLCKKLELKVVFSFHDFYTVCPTVKLLDEKMEYCRGICTPTNGQCAHELWPQILPPLKNKWVHNWRRMMGQMLKACDAFVTTSRSSYDQLISAFPWLSAQTFKIIPHGRQFAEFAKIGHVPSGSERLRLLVPGNISEAKGALYIRGIAERDKGARIEFHILGKCSRSLEGHPNIIYHGAYERHKLVDHVREINPHLGVLFSIWPETYCHTLTEMWACGLPVIAMDFGAVAERIRSTGGGWLLAPTDIKAIYEKLLEIAAASDDIEAKIEAIGPIQNDIQASGAVAPMADRYFELYQSLGLMGAPCQKMRPHRCSA